MGLVEIDRALELILQDIKLNGNLKQMTWFQSNTFIKSSIKTDI